MHLRQRHIRGRSDRKHNGRPGSLEDPEHAHTDKLLSSIFGHRRHPPSRVRFAADHRRLLPDRRPVRLWVGGVWCHGLLPVPRRQPVLPLHHSFHRRTIRRHLLPHDGTQVNKNLRAPLQTPKQKENVIPVQIVMLTLFRLTFIFNSSYRRPEV